MTFSIVIIAIILLLFALFIVIVVHCALFLWFIVHPSHCVPSTGHCYCCSSCIVIHLSCVKSLFIVIIVHCCFCLLFIVFVMFLHWNCFLLPFLCCLLHCFTYHCYCSFILESCSFILGSLCTVIYTLHESWIYFFIVNTEYCAVLEYCCNWRPEVPTVQPRSVLTHTRSHKQPLITHTLSLSHSHTCGRAGWRAACAVCRSAWVS